MAVSAVVLAAGKGTRMKSDLPKPLHLVRGRSLLAWVIHALAEADLDVVVVVVGHGRESVVASLRDQFVGRTFFFADQLSQRGTGDAAAVGLAELDLHDGFYGDDDHVVVLPGDTPLLTGATLSALVDTHVASAAAATLVTAVLDAPAGYGRVLRDATGNVQAIVEERDATSEQRAVREINAGMYCFRRSLLAPALRMISSDNTQGELYLTDVIGVLADAGHRVMPFQADAAEISGVNDRAQLGAAADVLARRITHEHMRNGVTIVQESSAVIDADVSIEPDVVIHGSTVIEGRSRIAAGAVIGPNTHLVNAVVGAGARVEASIVRNASVAAGSVVGPFEHLGEGRATG